MKHTIKYKGSEAQNHIEAMNDCRDWLGDKFKLVEDYLCAELSKDSNCKDAMKLALSFAGIEGYPAEVFITNCKELNSALGDLSNA